MSDSQLNQRSQFAGFLTRCNVTKYPIRVFNHQSDTDNCSKIRDNNGLKVQIGLGFRLRATMLHSRLLEKVSKFLIFAHWSQIEPVPEMTISAGY